MELSEWQKRSRKIVTTGLVELYSGNTGKIGDVVIVRLGSSWRDKACETYVGTITHVGVSGIRIGFPDDNKPDRSKDGVFVNWGDSYRSEVFLWPEKVTKVQPAEQPEPVTLFKLMCEYDSALGSLLALKPGYDEARERFINARAALGAVLGTHKDL